MISAPNIDPTVTAVTPTADPQGTAALQSQQAAGEANGTASFPAALEAEQNQGTAAPEAAAAPVQATVDLAAKLAAHAATQSVPEAIAGFATAPSGDSAALDTLPPAVEAAADAPQSGDSLPDDGNVLPYPQDLQTLILSLTASPLATPVTPPTPASTVAPTTESSAAPPSVPGNILTATDPGTRAQLEALRVAIAGLNRPPNDSHDAAGETATHRPGNPATGYDTELASGTFFRTPDANPGLPGDALTASAGPSGGGTGDAPGGSAGNSSQYQAPGTLPAPALLQPGQPALSGLAQLLQVGNAFAGPVHATGAAGSAAAPQTILPAASDLPALRPLGDASQWSRSLGDRLLVMADQGLQSATIRLQPEHLGPMEIRIQVDEGNAQVWFSAHHGETRSALQDAIPRLREMFSEQGLNLLQTSVDSGRGSFADRAVPLAPGMLPERENAGGDPVEAKFTTRPRGSAWRTLASSGSRVDLLV